MTEIFGEYMCEYVYLIVKKTSAHNTKLFEIYYGMKSCKLVLHILRVSPSDLTLKESFFSIRKSKMKNVSLLSCRTQFSLQFKDLLNYLACKMVQKYLKTK